jgi:hypothetical protein
MRDINRRFEANQEQDVAAKGDFIFLKSATGAISIDIQGRGVVGFEVGDSIKVKDAFSGFRIINKTGDINLVEVSVGDGDEFSRSLVSGKFEVTNLPDEYEDEKNDKVFSANIQGYNSNSLGLQIYNPLDSGKNIIIKCLKVRFFGGGGGFFHILRASSTLDSFITQLAVNFGPNYAVSKARFYGQSDTGINDSTSLYYNKFLSNEDLTFDSMEGVVLGPEQGLTIVNTIDNCSGIMNVVFKEEDV